MTRLFYIFIAILLFSGCQNRNQVTHNKRKYRKGYYKPNRAKVKHKKSNKQEEYAYESRSQQKQSQEKKNTSQSKENEKLIEKGDVRTFEEEGPKTQSKNVSSSHDQVDYQNSEEEVEKKTSSQNETFSKKNVSKPTKKKKLNWIYWVSLALLFIVLTLGILAFTLVFAAIAWAIILLLCIILALVIFGLVINILNIIKLEKNNSRSQKFLLGNSYFFAVFFSLAALAAIIFLIALLLL